MKLIALLIIAVSLVMGVIAGVTVYSPRLDLPDHKLLAPPPAAAAPGEEAPPPKLTLNAPAGARIDAAGERVPIAGPNTPLTPELLAQLRDAGVTRIRVKEVSLARWSEWWLFLLGSLGLAAGAFLVRRENRRIIAAAGAAQAAAGAGPDESFAAIVATVDRLRRDIPGMPTGEAVLKAMIDDLGAAQRTSIPAFISARPVLVGRLGLAGYARLMDAFAAAERAINRAWSAAADGVEPEALVCLDRAAELLAETKTKLGSGPTAA